MSSAGPLQEGLRAAELKSALDAEKLELQTSPGLAFENLTLLAEASLLRGSVKTLGGDKKEVVKLTQDA